MILIAAVDKNWAIGNKGQMLVTIPADQQFFRQETLGQVVIMGRKTLDCLPGGRPLQGRVNIVLSRNLKHQVKDAITCHDMDEIWTVLKEYEGKEIYVIGGQSIYEQFLPYCDMAQITWIDYSYDGDTYFPDLDRNDDWELTTVSEEQTYFDLCYEFRKYRRRK